MKTGSLLAALFAAAALSQSHAQAQQCTAATKETEPFVAEAHRFLEIMDTGNEDRAVERLDPGYKILGDVARLQLRRNLALRAERGKLTNRRQCIIPRRAEGQPLYTVTLIFDEDAERPAMFNGQTMTTSRTIVGIWRHPEDGRLWVRRFDVSY
ncbi:MAG: hypothetical protein QM750_12425 [Rubrivivax sp.]